jgi:CheY-like chemotaxis protein
MGPGERPPPCVLVVDDEPLVRDVLARAVRAMGLQALTAGSAVEALEACRLNAGRLALVLLDLNLPGLGGHAVLDGLPGIAPAVPVLLVTGAADLLGAEDLARLGVTGVLAKPVRLPDLEQAVRALLPPW